MKNTLKVSKIPGIGLALIAAITLALFLAACEIIPPEDEDLLTLSGSITISPSTNVTTGMELTASYSGSESVSYQWKKGDDNVGTNSNKYTPTEAGSYKVTVSTSGYYPKTSAPVTVTAAAVVSLPTLEGTWVSGPDNELGISSEIKLDNGNYEITLFNPETDVRLPDRKGTYTTNNGSITLKMTHIYTGGLTGLMFNIVTAFYLDGFESLDTDTWYTKAEIRARIDAANGPSVLYPDDGVSLAIDALDQLFQEATSDYSLSGNTLTFTSEDEDEDGEPVTNTTIYTRRETFSTIPDFRAWLSAQPNNQARQAYTVWLNLSNLGGNSTATGSVGKVLSDNSMKYVSLNFSGSTFTSIGESAFENIHTLTGVTLGSKVTSIGDKAFMDCDALTGIIIPDSVKNIGISAFEYCSSLTSVTLPDNDDFDTIYNRAFYGCSALASIIIPDSVDIIATSAFNLCQSLTSIIIPSSVTGIDSLAFYGCSNLASVKIEGSSVNIQATAFYGDLRAKFMATGGAGGPGTYTTTTPVGNTSEWTKSE